MIGNDINKNRFILQVFSNDYTKTSESSINFNIIPNHYIILIYQGPNNRVQYQTNNEVTVIQLYELYAKNNSFVSVKKETNIRIFYLLINAQ